MSAARPFPQTSAVRRRFVNLMIGFRYRWFQPSLIFRFFPVFAALLFVTRSMGLWRGTFPPHGFPFGGGESVS